MEKKAAAQFYDDIIQREKDSAAAKGEMDEAIESFASSNNVTVDGVKKAIKDRKAYLKDKAKFLVTDADSNKVFEAMNYEPQGELF